MPLLATDTLDLDFISDAALRKTIKEAIEYVVVLLDSTENPGVSDLYIEETYRVIILYVASIIEAIFLHCFKEKGHRVSYPEYKTISRLPSGLCYAEQAGPIVIAVEKEVDKMEHQLGLHELVHFFKGKKLIKPETVKNILEINSIRNTVHLSKARIKNCDIGRVEFAFNTLVHIIKNSPKLLK